MPTQTINLNNTSPAAPPTGLNVAWQADPPSLDPTVVRNVSANVEFATNSSLGVVQGDGDTLGVDAYGKISVATGVASKNADYTAVAADNGWLLVFDSAGAVTLTLPAVPPSGKWRIYVQNIGAGTLTISQSPLLLDGSAASLSLSQNQGMRIGTDGANYFSERGMGGSGGGGGSAGALTKIAEQILAVDTAAVSFSGIPATFRNLILTYCARGTYGAETVDVTVHYNGDTNNANYQRTFSYTVVSDTSPSSNAGGNVGTTPQGDCAITLPAASAVAGQAGVGRLTMYDYARTAWNKSCENRGVFCGSTNRLWILTTGSNWSNNAAINSIALALYNGGNFAAGSVFSLYGES